MSELEEVITRHEVLRGQKMLVAEIRRLRAELAAEKESVSARNDLVYSLQMQLAASVERCAKIADVIGRNYLNEAMHARAVGAEDCATAIRASNSNGEGE